MPLLPDIVPTRDIVIDGDTYTIKTMISGFERDQIRQAGFKMQIPRDKLESTNPDDMLDGKMNTAEMNLLKKKIFLKSWSHSVPMSASNMRRMPAHHDDLVLEEIDDILDAIGQPVDEDSPLDGRYTLSSESS